MTVTAKTKGPSSFPTWFDAVPASRAANRLEFKVSAGVVTILPKPLLNQDSGDLLTPAEAKRLRRSLKQPKEGKTRPWSQIKRELGL